ncbi:2-oxoglutarate and iron-dependent oxygenase domain-containing protein [Octadecabacter sp. 1_MG-2023]|uniref:isopenicillin N synthase family dioxygenase n=1 Tax=unclassified Octadecabacter TaxID=196158 RepID=UPI0026E1CAE9|nr:2-oxoglutarate and iron-dependent oxygenase domain-containing protein [Octadecabacter sp. 1_MG-2023]MDO6735627.1 2-oxoglutarate and iron-dependent oxygenase domain-containing protein [Octadecabacter sp. 1_MG-2023]
MTETSIPRIDAEAFLAGDLAVIEEVRVAAKEIGFLTLYNTPIPTTDIAEVFATYAAFFKQPAAQKEAVNMANTGSNRGWGAAGSEQVDPDANPDYKQVFDCGFEVKGSDLPSYAPNLWPEEPAEFKIIIENYYARALAFAGDLLAALAGAIGEDAGYFKEQFDQPMALLRGNYYPPRPADAGAKDFGIATHTDYGCLTLLAMDGTPGLEVRKRGGGWYPVSAPVGEFVINFGEMLEMWTQKRVVATPHRVIGGTQERLSIPLFFNPNADTNVAPTGSGEVIRAVDHLQKRFDETYLHLQDDDD